MRIRSLLCTALMGLAVAPSTLLHAQFKDPTPEELKMTSDPKAPGAAAVYLDREEVTNDPLHYYSIYTRIKILEEEGKKLATVEIPYLHGEFKVTMIRGRTIHPDGTIIPLKVKPEDLLVSKVGDRQIGKVVFNLPSAEVGSILEYRYQIDYHDNTYSSPQWRIQLPYYVHHAHFEFTPSKIFWKGSQRTYSTVLMDEKGRAANALLWWSYLPKGAAVKSDVQGKYSLDVNDIPAIPDEYRMPPLDSVIYRVLFYYSFAHSGVDFWVSEAKDWSKDVDHFAKPTGEMRKIVAGIVAPGDSDLVKAQKLYRAVQGLENTDYTRTRGKAEMKQLGLKEAKRAEDIWKQKSGSSEDIALLYLAMLRTAGITAYDAKVVNRDNGSFLPGLLDFDQFDDDLVLAEINGKPVPLDPGEKLCPFGMLNWKHAGASGIGQTQKSSEIIRIPLIPYTKNEITRVGDITIDAHGNAKGTVRIIMSGQAALLWRQSSLVLDKDELTKAFDRGLQSLMPSGMVGHLDHFLGLDNEDINLMAVVHVSGALGTATSKRLLLPGFFFESHQRQPFVQETKRLEPVDMHYGEKVTNQVTYFLPAGFKVEAAPPNAQFVWQHQAAFVNSVKATSGRVVVTHQLARGFTFVKPEDYAGLRDFYQRMGAADRQQLVLEFTAKEQGN